MRKQRMEHVVVELPTLERGRRLQRLVRPLFAGSTLRTDLRRFALVEILFRLEKRFTETQLIASRVRRAWGEDGRIAENI